MRRIDLKAGTLHNFAGIGETCYSGDSGPCSEAGLYLPLDVAFDSHNNLYICDSGSNRIRRVDRELLDPAPLCRRHGFRRVGLLDDDRILAVAIAQSPGRRLIEQYIADERPVALEADAGRPLRRRVARRDAALAAASTAFKTSEAEAGKTKTAVAGRLARPSMIESHRRWSTSRMAVR